MFRILYRMRNIAQGRRVRPGRIHPLAGPGHVAQIENVRTMAGMAGRPKTRARKAAAAPTAPTPPTPAMPPPAPAVPEAMPEPTSHTRAHDAPARARARDAHAGSHARERPPTHARPMSPGPKLRGAVDEAQTRTIDELTRRLRSAVTLRIERLLPVWCEGWCEDFPTDALESTTHLYEHIETEWGGRRYKVTALGEGDVILNVAKLAMTGRPRHRGRLIDRERWEGRSEADRTGVAAAAQGGDMASVLLPVFTLLLEQQRTASAQHVDGLRDLFKQHSTTTTELVKQLGSRRDTSSPRESSSLTEQLSEIVEANAAFEKVRKLFGAGAAARRAPREESDPMKAALQSAVANFMQNAFAPGAAAAAAASSPAGGQVVSQRPVRLVRPQPLAATESTTIPEAIPESGQ
jgi:hypothetical protein